MPRAGSSGPRAARSGQGSARQLGLSIGAAGAPALAQLQDGRKPHPKGRSMLQPGDRLTMHYGGGGGYGDPGKRDPAALQRDIEDGYVTPEAAQRLYGREC